MTDLIALSEKKAQAWGQSPFDLDTQQAVAALLQSQDKQPLVEAFHKDITFGTGGIRGMMGPGTNRINTYTLARCTQGLSSYLKQCHPGKRLKAAIAYDTRKNSQKFAQETAQVFSANDIEVFLFESFRPTPQLSFAIKKMQCDCGIVITASHNPPEDNGYKVYWSHGGQVVPPIDQDLIESINVIDYSDILFDPNPKLIHKIGSELDEQFCQSSIRAVQDDQEYLDRRSLKIVFTPLHGSTKYLLPRALKQAGFSTIHLVEEQATTDGSFDTVVSPNPEDPEAFSVAIERAKQMDADLVFANDPDGDRIGVAIKDFQGNYRLLNGNQMMCLMADFVLGRTDIKPNHFMASTLVSTPMFKKIVESYGIKCLLGLTGFKWINKMVVDFPELEYLFGGEESYGYMLGDFVGDKDGVTSALLLCELAASLKQNERNMLDKLQDLHFAYGFHHDSLFSIKKEGMEGAKIIQDTMASFRNNPPKDVAGLRVLDVCDYANQDHYLSYGDQLLPKSNVLVLELEGGNRVSLRPSGTEPKLKVYINLNQPLEHRDDYLKIEKSLSQQSEKIIQGLNIL